LCYRDCRNPYIRDAGPWKSRPGSLYGERLHGRNRDLSPFRQTLDECFDEIDSVFLIQHRVGRPAAEKIDKRIIANALTDTDSVFIPDPG
jgi:hypothetical protein